MKQLMVFVWCCVFLLVPAGCKDAGRQDRGSEEAVLDGGQFPEFLVGRWDSTEGNWQIVFAADGSISTVGIPGAPSELIPNETRVVGIKGGSESTFKLGNCVAKYSPETRRLTVFIDVEHLRIVYGPDIGMEGFRKDFFVGTVSEDGKTWKSSWIGLFEYGEVLSMDPNKVVPVSITFKKVGN